MEYKINAVFPIPVYIVKRDTNLTSREEEEIRKIIEEGMHKNIGNFTSDNSYIFSADKLKKLKQFCEQQIKIYVEQTINPKEKLDFYITQSWLNITKPGGYHHEHYHQNSIISGVFYISTVENDKIMFGDPNFRIKEIIKLETKEFNFWNAPAWFFSSNNNELILFPSWLNHSVEPNEKATTDRISISFNTFIKGTLGSQENLNRILLK